MKKDILIAMGCVSLAIAACQKDDAKVVSPEELITSDTWKIDAIGIDIDNNGSIDADVPGGFEACELDNLLTFNSNQTGVLDEGATKCDDADDQTSSFGWSLTSNGTVINVDGALPAGLSGDARIITLTNTAFILSKEITVPISTHIIVALKK